jgi:hypothetical protein
MIHEQDTEVLVGNLQPMQSLISKDIAQPRFNMALLGVFAAVGIFGVIGYNVAQRTKRSAFACSRRATSRHAANGLVAKLQPCRGSDYLQAW